MGIAPYANACHMDTSRLATSIVELFKAPEEVKESYKQHLIVLVSYHSQSITDSLPSLVTVLTIMYTAKVRARQSTLPPATNVPRGVQEVAVGKVWGRSAYFRRRMGVPSARG